VRSPGDVRAWLRGVWRTQLGLNDRPVTDETDFFESGGTSLGALTILNGIKDRFGLHVEPLVLLENPAFGPFAAEIERRCLVQPAVRAPEIEGELL
jgi:acyl carrier protein